MRETLFQAYCKSKKVKHWEVAEKLGVSAVTLSVSLRHELPQSKRNQYMKAVDEIHAERLASERR